MGEWINKNKKIILTIFLMLIIIISGTVAWLTWKSKESSLVLTVGEVNGPSLSLYPYQLNGTLSPVLSYESVDYVQVEATNNRSKEVKAKLFYNIKSIDSALISSDVKYTVTSSDSKNGTYTEYATGDFSSALAGNVLEIAKISIPANSNKFYRVYVWLDGNGSNSSNMQNKTLSIELKAEFVSEPAAPELDSGMIPVVIDNSGSETTIKTISKSDSNWYNYKNKEWANVVLTTSSSRSKYLNTTGVSVSESDILAYLVWIPRYKYKIWTTTTSSKGSEQTIEVVFEDKTTPKSTGTTIGSYRTHPAFTFGNTELNGIWVGKFETTGNDTTPTVKPNKQSLKSQNVSTQFATAQKFGTSTYGSTSKMDAHMMKNSEWGAVAYLSHSIYGINEEIFLNNSSHYYTGRSGGNVGGNVNTIANQYSGETSTNEYIGGGYYTWDGKVMNSSGFIGDYASDRTLGTKASTTGNITGIYDMSGGSLDRVMGNYNDMISSDGFSTMPDSKYYDKYTITSNNSCTIESCGGHALFETASWYDDEADFVNSSNQWFSRGGIYYDGVDAGSFSSSHNYGIELSGCTFRLVVAPL